MRDSFSDLYIIYQIKWLSPFHYWDQMDHNSQWVYYNTSPHLATLYMRCIIGIIIIIMFHVFFLSHLSRWVPLFSYPPTMCAVSVILVIDLFTFYFLLFTTGNTWNITVSEYITRYTAHCDMFKIVWTVWLFVSVLSFLPPQVVSPTLFHMLQWCVHNQCSLIAIWLSCFLWECMHGT